MKCEQDQINNTITLTSNKKKFNILQVTDMHLHHVLPGTKEKKDLEWVRKACEDYKVDLVINTGDLFCRNSYFLIKRVITQFEKIVGRSCPWAFAWGNHDNENFYKSFTKTFDKIEQLFVDLPNCYYLKSREFIENYDTTPFEENTLEYEAKIAPTLTSSGISKRHYDGFYGGNYIINLERESSSRPDLSLFLLNSRRNHSVPPNARKWIRKYVDSVKSHESSIPALAFYHVPNIEFDTLWNEKKATGFKREHVCYDGEDGTLHKFFQELGNVKGCFVGHDHVNDYYAELDGIYYVYGRKTGLSGYGGRVEISESEEIPSMGESNKKKVVIGGKLITIDFEHNTWGFKSVLIDGKEELAVNHLPLD